MRRLAAADPDAIAAAAAVLRSGGLVAFPTETVYGLGACADDPAAIARIYAAKGRPARNPLIVHTNTLNGALALAVMDHCARILADACWPGPLTLVLPRRAEAELAPAVTAGLGSVGVRIPDHPVALALLAAVGRPVAAPSANPSGRLSPTTAQHVVDGLGAVVDLVLDGGPCAVGVESTVVELTGPGPALLRRAGGLAVARLEALIGPLATLPGDDARPTSPGQTAHHYAPLLPLRLDATDVRPDEALLAFGPVVPADSRVVLNLSPSADLAEAARNLFAMLHALDASGASAIAAMPIPGAGLALAIRDRLARAALPKRGPG